MSAKQPTPPLPKWRDNTISGAMADLIMQHTKQIEAMNSRILLSQTIAETHLGVLRQRIEAAKQRLESLSGEQIGQAELYAVIEILEGKT